MPFSFFRGKKVFITGHTGFKGSWLCRVLLKAGADVTGYSLEPPTTPNLFSIANIENNIKSIDGDIRDFDRLFSVIRETKPDIVLHLAAQPIVRDSYKNPRDTYDINVMGTVNILECVRRLDCVRSVLNVTTDKVYFNKEWTWGYREDDPLDGYDPYSNSKSCSELVTHSYKNSFLDSLGISTSTARAGNVIGGGDFANDRIIPDCVRAVKESRPITVRNPYSTRPYQHVLEPIFAYLTIAQKQYEDKNFADCYNVGPEDCDCVTTGELVSLFCSYWGPEAKWRDCSEANAPHESTFLKLDCSKIGNILGWKPRWHISAAIEKTCEWTKTWLNNGDVPNRMDKQISAYIEECV